MPATEDRHVGRLFCLRNCFQIDLNSLYIFTEVVESHGRASLGILQHFFEGGYLLGRWKDHRLGSEVQGVWLDLVLNER